MKFIHLSDLHFGKRLNEFSLLDDQRYIWKKICDIIQTEQPDAVILAGDIYDKSVASAEAVQLFDQCLSQLVELTPAILMISGNHDSTERISFGSDLLKSSHVYIAPVFHGEITQVMLQDDFGDVNFFLLPFVRPPQVRAYFPDEKIDDYQDAMNVLLAHTPLDTSVRNVMVTHQTIIGASMFGTEERPIGGTDQISGALFHSFDYTALGHIHKAQALERENIRYCGSPLKYSLSEVAYEKSVTVVELREKGEFYVREVALHPLHDMREIRGSYAELTARSTYAGTKTDDYLHITLTDETDIPDAISRLRVIYPNLIKLDYDNSRTRKRQEVIAIKDKAEENPFDLFEKLYKTQNNQEMTIEQKTFVQNLIAKIWDEEEHA
ncbi:MAG: exonuclease SbcCD subunit D [Ruminococcus sp.]|nr:exonuclease SbcCD subunit D [Ruminococcus sp.]